MMKIEAGKRMSTAGKAGSIVQGDAMAIVDAIEEINKGMTMLKKVHDSTKSPKLKSFLMEQTRTIQKILDSIDDEVDG